MQISIEENRVHVRTPCKINPYLDVLRRRSDGYHDLETIMLAVDLCDELIVNASDDSTWHLDINANSAWIQNQIGYKGERLGNVEQNLVWKALSLLAQELNIDSGIHCSLNKTIPIQAGLGGGSSDAAAALVAGQLAWTGRYNHLIACKLAEKLGSDVNFFLEGFGNDVWFAACRGRGEQVAPMRLNCDAKILLVCPPFGCNTESVFRSLVLDKQKTHTSPFELWKTRGDVKLSELENSLMNGLSDAAMLACPELRSFTKQLHAIEPNVKFAMSGSGSTLFAICDNNTAVRLGSTLANTLNCFTYIGNCWKTRSIAEQIDDLTIESTTNNE